MIERPEAWVTIWATRALFAAPPNVIDEKPSSAIGICGVYIVMLFRAPLDWLNFFLADIRGGLAPYLGVFLLTQENWDPATIGAVLTVSGLIGITMHTPIGALIDATNSKRALIIVGTGALALSALAIVWSPTFAVVLTADILLAIAGAIFVPTVAAITLGMTQEQALPERLGRNTAFDRAGNIFIAILAGLVGWAVSQRAVFFLVPLFAVLTTFAVLSIPAAAIDHDRARGLNHQNGQQDKPSGWSVLFQRQPLLILTVANALFHFANAPMLPLVSQKLALANPGFETALTSACIVTAQLVTIPVALLVGWKANSWGRKALLLVGFAALPIRGVLYTLSDNAVWLVNVQILDGVSAGTLDALIPLVLADVMQGTGRYNLARGMLGTVQGVAGSLSNVVAGALVVGVGYGTSFYVLAGTAIISFLLVLVAMPETARPRHPLKPAIGRR